MKKFGAEADGPRYCVKSTDDKLDGCDCRTKALATPATPATPAAMETWVEIVATTAYSAPYTDGVPDAEHDVLRRRRTRTRRRTRPVPSRTAACTTQNRGVHDDGDVGGDCCSLVQLHVTIVDGHDHKFVVRPRLVRLRRTRQVRASVE